MDYMNHTSLKQKKRLPSSYRLKRRSYFENNVNNDDEIPQGMMLSKNILGYSSQEGMDKSPSLESPNEIYQTVILISILAIFFLLCFIFTIFYRRYSLKKGNIAAVSRLRWKISNKLLLGNYRWNIRVIILVYFFKDDFLLNKNFFQKKSKFQKWQ